MPKKKSRKQDIDHWESILLNSQERIAETKRKTRLAQIEMRKESQAVRQQQAANNARAMKAQARRKRKPKRKRPNPNRHLPKPRWLDDDDMNAGLFPGMPGYLKVANKL